MPILVAQQPPVQQTAYLGVGISDRNNVGSHSTIGAKADAETEITFQLTDINSV
jgi:hypothetical protein